MSTSAHKRRCYLANNSARDIANSLFQKWAVKGFFRRVSAANRGRGQPRRGYRRPKPTAHSDVGRLRSRRAAGFLLHTFLSPSKEKCERPIGLQALLPRRSRRVIPLPEQGVCACGRTKGLSARPLETFGHQSWREPHRTASSSTLAGVGASIPTRGKGYAPAGALEASLGANHRRGPHCRALSTPLRATAPHAFFPFVNAPYTTSINPAKNIRYNG